MIVGGSIEIRTLRAGEAGLHKDVRLRALRDTPNSFGGTIDVEENKPWDYWETQAKALTDPGRNVMFLAQHGANIIGMAYGLKHPDRDNESRIGGMWVDPSVRRNGVGRALLNSIIDWATERGSRRVGLWAPSASFGAIAFYRSMAFRETANRDHLRAGSALEIVEMLREL